MTELTTIVLAAGEGTRMRSRTPKLLHKVAGLEIIGHVVRAAKAAGSTRIAVIVSPGADDFRARLSAIEPSVEFFVQDEPLGTAHAASMARPAFEVARGHVAVVYGDHPLLTGDIFRLVTGKLDRGWDGVILGFEPEDPTGYGRLLTDGEILTDIREHKDASEEERRVGLCNACILGFSADCFRATIDKVGTDNAQKEYYLGDLVPLANAAGYKVSFAVAPEEDVMGVNTRAHQARAETLYQQRLRAKVLAGGVTLVDPATSYFSYDTEIGEDVLIEPGVFIGPGVKIARDVIIKAWSHIEGAIIGEGAIVGPFARLRPGTGLAENAKVGNFCEVKNATIGEGAKINHLTYVGDASVGAHANLGAGTITCNYDGVNKHMTEIGDNVFVGSNSALVAPVRIGDGALVAAGSVITRDVGPDEMAVARGIQVNKPGYAETLRQRARARKKT